MSRWGAAAGCSAVGSPRNTSAGGAGGFGPTPDAAVAGFDAGLVPPEPEPDGGNSLGDSACTGTSFQAEPFPLDIFVMLDQSGSMNEDFLLCPSTCDKIALDLMAQIDIVLGCLTIVK